MNGSGGAMVPGRGASAQHHDLEYRIQIEWSWLGASLDPETASPMRKRLDLKKTSVNKN
jgi:hypothetical protein